MDTRKIIVTGIAGIAALGVVGAPQAAPPPTPRCAVPVPAAPPYAPSDSNTLTWSQPAGTLEGNGYSIDVASSPARASGALLDVEQTIDVTDASARSAVVSALSEGPHWYAIKAKTKPQTCLASDWSQEEVSTVQDATGPTVAITSPEEGHLFVAEPVTISGTLTDAGVGPGEATVTLANTTPVVGGTVGAPAAATADASDGTFDVTFAGVAPGTYTGTVSGTDLFGNASASPASVSFTVVLAG